MPTNKRIIVAVDKSSASNRAVGYVADILAGHADFHVGLLHLELPPRMLEWGGSENPKIEDKIADERANAYGELETRTLEGGETLLHGFQRFFSERKVDVAAQLVQFEEPLNPKHISQHILKIAMERDYGTVVVGRHSFSGLQRIFRHHVGEELVRTGKGLTIWVVE